MHTFSVIYCNRAEKGRNRIDVACFAAGGMRMQQNFLKIPHKVLFALFQQAFYLKYIPDSLVKHFLSELKLHISNMSLRQTGAS